MIEQFFSRDTITATRWKNGGGVTREVAKSPSQAPFWRVSIANVDQEGPFSSFEGLDRILTVIEGKGMVLRTYERGSGSRSPQSSALFWNRGDRWVVAQWANSGLQLNFRWVKTCCRCICY